MECLYCKSKTQVVNSRPLLRINNIWRRRKCVSCKSIFTSIESINYPQALRVIKANGQYLPFERDQLLLSIYDACRHREYALKDAQALTAIIMSKLLEHIDKATISVQDVKIISGEVLKRFDKAAQVHYLAYHPIKN